VTPTRLRTLVLCGLAGALAGYLLAELAYGSLPPLPSYAPVTLLLLAVVEALMARVVSDRVRGRARPGARPVHPLQVARAVALAKASSPTGSLLLGGYLAVLVWLLPREAEQARDDALVSGASALAALLLVLAALALERAGRTPDSPAADGRLGSRP
jgi:uncharacterized membrane protein YbhN (UPF0104 family)